MQPETKRWPSLLVAAIAAPWQHAVQEGAVSFNAGAPGLVSRDFTGYRLDNPAERALETFGKFLNNFSRTVPACWQRGGAGGLPG